VIILYGIIITYRLKYGTTIQREHTRHEAILFTMDECKADAVINSIILVSDVTP